MKTYFDEATDKRLLEAQTEEEVKAIIAETPEAEKLADKTDLVMAEIKRIKGSVDSELDLDELDSAAGGAKRQDITLSETQGCIATFFLEDDCRNRYCTSNDQCAASNEYKYHNTRYSNCKKGGRHNWEEGEFNFGFGGSKVGLRSPGYRCTKCDLRIEKGCHRFDD